MSDSYSVAYLPKAVDDIRDIYRYIAFELLDPGAAEKLVNRIRKSVASLDCMPFRNPVVDWEPLKTTGMRAMPVDSFEVFYMAIEDTHAVVAVRTVYGESDMNGIALDMDSD